MSNDPAPSDPALDDIRPHVFRPQERITAHMAPQKNQIASGAGPMAIISDIHANLEALTAVLAEIDRRGIKRIICLGDVVGYGPNPLECIDTVIARSEFSLMGNHDFAILFEPYNFNTAAENAAFWTRSQFENDSDIERRNRRWKYLGSMPTRMSNERFVCFHGSPRRPINEYVFPDDIYTAPQKMSAIFDRFERLCFVGHTHVPGVFVPDPDFYSPDELTNRFKVTQERAMINVGSVGQPRDRNPDASFVILHDADAEGGGVGDDEGTVEFVRTPYDVQTTVEKVKSIDALDNFLGARLLDGR
jgi:diadenosine tetraphosphatase ApaH/serine/threonine PP2A family protein phosphatase